MEQSSLVSQDEGHPEGKGRIIFQQGLCARVWSFFQILRLEILIKQVFGGGRWWQIILIHNQD